MMNMNQLKSIFTISTFFLTPVFAGEDAGFTQLQNDSEQFVLDTCLGFGGRPVGELEEDLNNICSSMVANSQNPDGKGSRQLNSEELGGAYQNVVPEETFSPLSVSADAALTTMVNLSAHVVKLRKAGQILAYNDNNDFLPYYASNGMQGGAAGDEGGLLDNRLSFFINARGGFGQTKRTDRENSSDFNSGGIVAGLDYRVGNNVILGLSGGYSHFNLDFDQNINVAGGDVEANQYDISTFASFFMKDFYIDGLFSYGWTDYSLNRGVFIGNNNASNPDLSVISRQATANPDGTQLAVSLATGYDFHYQGLSYGPYLQLAYFNAQIDGYEETGAQGLNLLVGHQNIDSLETILGAHVAYAISLSSAVIIPQIRVDWHHEFFDGARSLDVKYVNAADSVQSLSMPLTSNGIDSDYVNLGIGVSANFKGGMQGFLNYDTVLALRNIESHVFSTGFRYEF